MIIVFVVFFSQLGFSNKNADSDIKTPLVIGISQEYETLHPHIMAMAAVKYIQYMFNRTLVTMDANLEWVPVLAKDIPSEKNKKVKVVTQGPNRFTNGTNKEPDTLESLGGKRRFPNAEFGCYCDIEINGQLLNEMDFSN